MEPGPDDAPSFEGFQFIGHAFEGKKPSFVDDRRQLLTGLLWWTQKVGLPLVERSAPAATT